MLGVPIVVQPSKAEKNRVGNYADPMIRPEKGPMKLYVGNLHCNISDEMLKGIFEPFGRIQSIQLMKDQESSEKSSPLPEDWLVAPHPRWENCDIFGEVEL